MTDTFMGYHEDFEQCRDEAVEDIKAVAAAKNAAERADAVTRAEGSIEEAERYMRILESESRAGDAQERRKMHQMLRSSKSQLDKLKSLLERNKLIGDSQQRLNERPQNLTAQERMVRYNERLDKGGQYLKDAEDVIVETEAIAQNVAGNLQQQREALGLVKNHVEETHDDVHTAEKHLQSLKRKTRFKIIVLYFVIGVLSAHIIYSILHKATVI